MGFDEQLAQFVFAGLKSGAIYALMALGFTIVYAATGAINFAQGEFFMLGGMLAVWSLDALGVRCCWPVCSLSFLRHSSLLFLRNWPSGPGGMRTRSRSSCLLYTSPSPRDGLLSRMPSSA